MTKEDMTDRPKDFFDELEQDFAGVAADMHPLTLPACVLLGSIIGLVILNIGR